ncbi:BPTF-associated chromatin complex component 1-like isoform X2 [Haliotis cracherodii]|uniref:BPTF-associated chromatin complex component 1-like isoform X2 n=1 Tax=Haliotis cracherodii TaxID=6455 RepID=UPI0039E78FDC
MSSASKVGEIFTAAGSAFSKLGELTMQLHPTTEQSPTSSQIKNQLKRKAFEDAGIQPTVETSPTKTVVKHIVTHHVTHEPQTKKQKTSDVTLSALNAPESDVDIEGLGDGSASKKLDFDSDVDSSML